MQSSAAAKPCTFVLLVVMSLAAGCGALETGSAGESVLRSEALAFDGEPDAGGAADPADEADPIDATGPAVGSSELDPALSPDPGISYPADTCYIGSVQGRSAEEVGCGQPHDIEVYASVDLQGGADAPYQGLDSAMDLCGPVFRQRTGMGLNLATVFERSVLRPSEETWADGERTVTCYVVFPEATTERLASIDPVRSFGRVSVFGLAVGDCLVAFDRSASWFELAACDQPHEAEVFVADRQVDPVFPGDTALDPRATGLCFGEPFETFVGRDYATSTVFSIVSVPTAETWDQGDRTINCILTDELIRSSSFRDSGL